MEDMPMLKVLFVAADLERTGAGKQLVLLGRGLPRDRFDVQVCVLGQEGPWARSLRQAGLEVTALQWQHSLDLGAPARLRRLATHWRPNMIHAWQPWAWRTLALAL